jgi:eukaryotic-like serine/threonine-protein kinase
MMSEHEVYDSARGLDAIERSARLDAACAGDDRLRQRIELLLEAEIMPGGILYLPGDFGQVEPDSTGTRGIAQSHSRESDSVERRSTLPATNGCHSYVSSGLLLEEAATSDRTAGPIAERSAVRIGPYKILEELGEGAMGIVYLAEQERPVRRRVALKIIKPGMDTKQVVARFEAERQALALMDHSSIARVFDAGATDAGQPYFVMKLVKGVPITEYCDKEKLTTRERLELFILVCQAIQHAHQKGIIHRDVKPSNVIVARHDGKSMPTVIDFGVAKAIDHRLTEKTLFTQFGTIIGTPGYMSPEQADPSGLDIDTRADIYGLGVMLYELMMGCTLMQYPRLPEVSLTCFLERIKHEEPSAPSVRLNEMRDQLPAVAAGRRTEPAQLRRLLNGELDWITMRALEKDRSRRYETAGALASDV